MGLQLIKVRNVPGRTALGVPLGDGPLTQTKEQVQCVHRSLYQHSPPDSGQRWIQGAPPRPLMFPHSPSKAQGLTTARLTQAVASWVRVASSSWSCIFFSSFLETEEKGRREPPAFCSWDTYWCRL